MANLLGKRITSAGELGGSDAGARDDEGDELAQPQRHQGLAGGPPSAKEIRHCPPHSPRQRFFRLPEKGRSGAFSTAQSQIVGELRAVLMESAQNAFTVSAKHEYGSEKRRRGSKPSNVNCKKEYSVLQAAFEGSNPRG